MGPCTSLRPWLASGLALVLPAVASARPDEGTGLFTYDASDELEYIDSEDGLVRVHFSVSGPNVTLLDDDDGDGRPDFPVTIVEEVATVLVEYEHEGFRRPVMETEVGLEAKGGSDALDVYLVDFGGSSDGQFGVDRCRSGVCAGHLLIENDFAGYGYASLYEAARVLASHELFHGVQYAYTDDLDPWFSEGTATWAEHLLEPEIDDYIRFCKSYLADVGRSIDRPPAGTVTSFSYGTALFFGFVQERHSSDVMVDMMDHLADAGDGDEVAAISAALADSGDTLSDAWVEFATWNLATGRRSGIIDSYPYADRLAPGVSAEGEGTAIEDDHRFYPLAASYFRIDHPGGELLLGVGEDNDAAVVFRVFPVADGSEDADIGPALETWSPDEQDVLSFGEQPAGGYWLMGTFPEVAPESEKRVFCFGGPDDMATCLPEEADDTGTEDTGTDDTDTDPEDTDSEPAGGDDGDGDKGGCAVVSTGAALGWTSVFGLVLAGARRRDSHA